MKYISMLPILVSLAAAAAMASEGGTITLGVGQEKVITVGYVDHVAVGDPNIANVKSVGGNQLLILGVANGRTTLLLFRANGTQVSYAIVVRAQDPKEIVSEVRALLGDREGIELRIVGDRVYMDGEALTTEDYDRVQQIVALYPSVKSFVRPSNNAARLAANNLNSAYQKQGLQNINTEAIGSTLFLQGSVPTQADIKRADLIAQALGEKPENLLTVGIKPMILVEVQFVEIRRNDDINIGLQWPLNITSPTGAQTTFQLIKPLPQLGDTQTQPQAFVQETITGESDFGFGFRFDNGYGRLLSQPKLVCASGSKAHFLVGGEIPIVIVTANTTDVMYKQFGVILDVQPTADAAGDIDTQIKAEVSNIDRTLTVEAAGISEPGFRTRQVKTDVTVQQGQTIVLSGIFNYDQQKNVSKFPLLGHIPILGELFKSRGFQDRKTELAVFITPKIVTPADARIRKLIHDAELLYKAAADQVGFSIFD